MPNNNFEIFIYDNELEYLRWLVLKKPDIETGGDLFGLWRSGHTAVVHLVLGPGKKCSRTATSFHQDVKYLENVGQALTSSQGLCNIGEWHSHHRIGLAIPSDGDQRTVWNHMDSVAGGRFLVFIASITGPERQPSVDIGCFMFRATTREMVKGSLTSLPRSSPLRLSLNDTYIKPGTEQDVDWQSFWSAAKETRRPETTPGYRNHSTEAVERRYLKQGIHEMNMDVDRPTTPDLKRNEHIKKSESDFATSQTKLKSTEISRSYGALLSVSTESDSSKDKGNIKYKSAAKIKHSAKQLLVIKRQPSRTDQLLPNETSPVPHSPIARTEKSLFDCC